MTLGGTCRDGLVRILQNTKTLAKPTDLMVVDLARVWRAWQDSNLRTRLRRPVLYPLSYRRTL